MKLRTYFLDDGESHWVLAHSVEEATGLLREGMGPDGPVRAMEVRIGSLPLRVVIPEVGSVTLRLDEWASGVKSPCVLASTAGQAADV